MSDIQVLSIVTNTSPFYKNQVKAIERTGISVTSLSLRGSNPETVDHNTTTTDTLLEYLSMYGSILSSQLKSYDLIHANYGSTAPLALFQSIRPVVITLWGSDLMGRIGRLTTQCSKHCDEVIVMSEEMAKKMNQNTHVIPHGVDLHQFRPMAQSPAQDAIGWNQDINHILFPYDPSRPVKNYSLAETIVDKARTKLSMPINLQAVYGIDHNKVPLYMNAADALLLTSHREGSPNSVKEAMACNLPVVATDVGDVAEKLGDVSNSYVGQNEAELTDGLCTVLRDGNRSNGRKHVQELSLDRMGERILHVYEQALE